MDILDIVNNVVSKNEEKNIDSNIEKIKVYLSDGKSVDDIARFLNVDIKVLSKKLSSLGMIKSTISNKELTLNKIQEAVYNLYKGISMSKIASELKTNPEDLENTLVSRNYQKIWIVSNNLKFPLKLTGILKALNIDKKSIETVSHEFNIDPYVLKAGLREVWILETHRDGINSYTKLNNDLLLVTATENGELKYIVFKGNRLITGLEINEILEINSKYYFTLEKRKFVETLHYFNIDKEKLYDIKFTLPHLEYLMNEVFYSQKGLELFFKITNKEEINTQTLTDYFGAEQIISTKKIVKTTNDLSSEKYSFFFNKSHPEGEKGIINDIVIELNNGLTIYDYSQKYAKSRKFRAKFSADLQKKIEDAGFKYDGKTKKWEKLFKTNEIQNDHQNNEEEVNENLNEVPIETLVTYINEVNSFSKAEKKLGITALEIRLRLKENGFTYDSLFKKWTSKSRKQLLEDTSIDLMTGKLSFNDLEKNGVAIESLKKKLEEEKLSYFPIEEKNEAISENHELHNFEDKEPVINPFSETEVRVLREIISKWEKGNNSFEEKSNEKVESIVLIKKSLLSKIELFSDAKNISRSKLIENALDYYFENHTL